MDPKEIFELIIKADEKLKYATDANRELRSSQARTLLEQARDAAREIGNEALVQQAETRLARSLPNRAQAAEGAQQRVALCGGDLLLGERARHRDRDAELLEHRRAAVAARDVLLDRARGRRRGARRRGSR